MAFFLTIREDTWSHNFFKGFDDNSKNVGYCQPYYYIFALIECLCCVIVLSWRYRWRRLGARAWVGVGCFPSASSASPAWESTQEPQRKASPSK